MLVIYSIIVISCSQIRQVECGQIPNAHVPVLERLISKYLNVTPTSQSSIVELLFGEGIDPETKVENLDVNVLNHDTLKNIIETAREKENYVVENTRRREELADSLLMDPNNNVISNKLFDLMTQSIYGVRYRLAETKLMRLKFRDDPSYNIGVIVSNVYQIIFKCEFLYDQLKLFKVRSFMLWHLIIYEKILASSVDVENLVHRAFLYHEMSEEQIKTLTGGNNNTDDHHH